jgi:hypothetical protein
MLIFLRRAMAAVAILVSVFSPHASLGAQVLPGEGGNCVSCTQIPVDEPNGGQNYIGICVTGSSGFSHCVQTGGSECFTWGNCEYAALDSDGTLLSKFSCTDETGEQKGTVSLAIMSAASPSLVIDGLLNANEHGFSLFSAI